MPRYILVKETASTNTYLKTLADTLPGGTVIYTHRQTAGRGQKGNSWEAEPGKNLTFSMLLKRPAVAVRDQFVISEAVSLAIVDAVREALADADAAKQIAVKWPNDIYCGDRKLCGLLIENSLDDHGIAHSVVGVGLNVNQSAFVSDAPNPVSMCQVSGHEFELETLLHDVCERIEQYCAQGAMPQGRRLLHEQYLAALYRNDGRPHSFALPDGTQFAAIIHDVAPDGMLILRTPGGDDEFHSYAFKQVQHVINEVIL